MKIRNLATIIASICFIISGILAFNSNKDYKEFLAAGLGICIGYGILLVLSEGTLD